MRLISRWSSVAAATALVGTSFAVAGPALADEPTDIDTDSVATEPESLPASEDNEKVAEDPGEEAPEPEVAQAGPEGKVLGYHNIATVRGMDDGQRVVTEGWVTAAWPTGGLHGFTIQSAGTGGACDLTGESDAIFVYTNHSNNVAPTPEVGDYVIVDGDITTYNGLRQISTGDPNVIDEHVWVVDPGEADPANPISCEWPATAAERMSIQSMLYQPTSEAGFTVTDTYGANTFGELGLSTSGAPLWQPSDVTADLEQREAIAEFNDAHKLAVDDGNTFNYTSNATAKFTVPPYVSATGQYAVGAEVTFETAMIMDYRNKAWKLNPTTPVESSAEGVVSDLAISPVGWTMPAAPGNLGGDFVVGGFNVENYFPTALGADWSARFPDAKCESYNDNAGNPITVDRCNDVTVNDVTVSNPRGAWTQEMLDYQTNRLVTSINELDAAALGLMELQNSYKLSFGDEAEAGASAAYLVDALNKAAGTEKWAYVNPDPANQEPIDEMDVMYPGMIYQPAKVTAVEGGQLTLNDQSGADEAFGNARAPFGQLFEPADGGEPFFLVANHFKSKSGSGSGDNADTGEGGWNGDRIRQATALAQWANGPAKEVLAERTGVEVNDIVLVGDFNSYTFEKPMLALYDEGFTNVNIVDGKPENASYNYSGLNGSLDHVIVSDSADERITGHAIWNVNSNQQIGLNYSRYNVTGGEFVQKVNEAGAPLRASDHDPAVVGFNAGQAPTPSDSVDLTLLNINDFHGRIDGTLDADANAITASPTIGFAYTVDSLRNAAPYDNSLFLSAGDNVGATLFPSALQQDQPTIDMLNLLGLEASAVGNHEFDAGWADLRDRLVEEFDGKLLAANVFNAETDELVLPAYDIVDAAGLKVAVIGAVTQDTPTLVNPDNVAGLRFGDPVEGVNDAVAELKALDAADQPDIIVAEYHEGAAAVGTDTTLEQKLEEGGIFARIVLDTSASVDAIFNGHTHQKYTWNGPVPNSEGQTRPIVSTGNYGENVGKVVLTVDKESNVVEDYSMDLVNVADYTEGLSVEEMKNANETMGEVYAVVLEALQYAKVEGSVPVAQMTQTISRDYTKGEYVDGKWQKGETGSANNRDNESPMGILVGNMLRDGQMATLPNAPDFGVTNPGGLRTDFTYTDENKGIITVADARAVLPFNNSLSVAQMTGSQIVKMLEQQWQRDAKNEIPSRSYLQLGLSDNISYTYHEIDDPAHAGAKLGVIDSVTLNGEALDMDATYNVGTFEFLAAGGDNFWVFQDANVIDTGRVDWESWLEYLSAASGKTDVAEGEFEFTTPIAPDFARLGVMVEGVPEAGLVAGQEVTLTFRNMNVHAVGAPANTELTVTLAGEEIGAFPIEKEQLENGNWTDWSEVRFTVPAGFGEGDLVATAAPTGTKVVVPLVADSDQPNVRRLAGSTRYGTNLAVNEATGLAEGAPVFVVTGADYADALSAAPAAALHEGGLFMTQGRAVPVDTLKAIVELDPSAVNIVGGTGAVSSAAAIQLRAATGVFPTRVAGANRYETSAMVFQSFFSNASVDTAFVATGRAYPDAISASAAAGAVGGPVLLVDGTSGKNILSESTQLLKRLGVEDVKVVGGTGAVNKTIATNLEKDFSVDRLAGNDRYATNMVVNDYVNGVAGDVALTDVWVATGKDFPDALSAAPVAGKLSGRLVLSNGKCIPAPVVSDWIKGADSQVEWTTLVGGKGVLPEALMSLPQCDAPAPTNR